MRVVSPGPVKFAGRGLHPLLVPLVATIQELHPDEGLAVGGEDPAVLLDLFQASLEADAQLPGAVGAESASAVAGDALEEENVLVLDAPERVLRPAAPRMLDHRMTRR